MNCMALAAIKTQANPISDRMGLAGEHKAAINFVLFKRVIGIHAHLPFEHLRATGATYARLAGVGHINSRREHRVEHRLPAKCDPQFALDAIGND